MIEVEGKDEGVREEAKKWFFAFVTKYNNFLYKLVHRATNFIESNQELRAPEESEYFQSFAKSDQEQLLEFYRKDIEFVEKLGGIIKAELDDHEYERFSRLYELYRSSGLDEGEITVDDLNFLHRFEPKVERIVTILEAAGYDRSDLIG